MLSRHFQERELNQAGVNDLQRISMKTSFFHEKVKGMLFCLDLELVFFSLFGYVLLHRVTDVP